MRPWRVRTLTSVGVGRHTGPVRAVEFSEYGGPLTLREVADPDCPAAGVVVRVRATGVCRSDWHAWQGHEPVRLPHVPGHELAGVVEQVGAQVRGWRGGERVTVPFVCGCGRCAWCREGQAQVCPDQTQPGFTGPGSFADLVAIEAADANLVRLPDQVGFEAAASLGCRFATAFRALTVHGRLGPEEWLAVHGCGGVGLSAVHIGLALGARVVAVDVNPVALRRAEALGAEVALDAMEGSDVASRVQEVCEGGAHVSLDALGSAATASASIRSLRRRGRHVQVGLLGSGTDVTALPMALVVARELEVLGSHGMPARDYPAMLDLVVAGRLEPQRLVGEVVGLEQAGPRLAAMSHTSSLGGLCVVRP